tara:strand:+ start:372 stop:536 length:165 start_codon:yes stop_codon:yes gene_type:complete
VVGLAKSVINHIKIERIIDVIVVEFCGISVQIVIKKLKIMQGVLIVINHIKRKN